jgi:hypothetical protein
MCYRCDSDSTENMQPPAKKPKLESPLTPAVTEQFESAPQGLDQKKTPRRWNYDQLIGMALHDAPNRRLDVDGVYRWIIDNVPDYDLKNSDWRNAVWIALAMNQDFKYQDGGSKGVWTFRDGASTKHRPRDELMAPQTRAGASSQNIYDNLTQTKQGGDAPKSLAPDHDLVDDDFKPSGTPMQLSVRSRSGTVSALPSTIDETVDMIDLTQDEDEQLPPVTDSQGLQKSAAGRTIISLLHETPEDVSENNQRSSFVGFGQPTWMKRTSVTPTHQSLTPFRDRILETAPDRSLERLSGTEKWKAANRYVHNLLGSPPRAIRPPDRARTSILRSPTNRPRLMSLGSQPPESAVVPSRENLDHGTGSTANSPEPIQLDVDDVAQNGDLLQPAPNSTEVNEKSAAIHQSSTQGTPAQNDQSMPMDLDLPAESHEPEPEPELASEPIGFVLPEPAQISDETMDHVEPIQTPHSDEARFQEPLLETLQPHKRSSHENLLQERHLQESPHEEHTTEEPVNKEPIVEEPLAEKTPINNYADLAVQTDSAAVTSLALGDITHISLEPRVPVQVAPTAVRETADSTTQTEHVPEQQAVPQPQPSLPEVPSTTAQEGPTGPSLPWTNSRPMTQAELDKEGLRILREIMHPTQETRSNGTKSTQEARSNRTTRSSDNLQAPQQEEPESDPFFFDHEAKMEEIRARPTRKKIFGKIAESRIAGNDALTRLNKIKLGNQRLGTFNMYKGYTEEQIAEEKRLNSQEGYYNTLEELLNLPQQVVPLIHEGQLAFRDYAPALVSCVV